VDFGEVKVENEEVVVRQARVSRADGKQCWVERSENVVNKRAASDSDTGWCINGFNDIEGVDQIEQFRSG
jgi:hypothetical protein